MTGPINVDVLVTTTHDVEAALAKRDAFVLKVALSFLAAGLFLGWIFSYLVLVPHR